MGELLKRIFNIRAGEGGKVLAFTLLAVLLNAGLGLGMSAADSMFLSHVGAEHLPAVYLGAPLALLAYIPFSVWMMGRFGKAGLFRATLLITAVGGVGVCAGAALPGGWLPEQALYYAARIYTGVWYVALYSLLWSFIDSYFDILDAKRLFSLFAAGTSLGMMAGGAMVVGLVEVMGVMEMEWLFLVWSLVSLTTLPVLAWVKRRWQPLDDGAGAVEARNPGLAAQWHEVLTTARRSRFLWVFVIVLVTTLVINTLCEFRYMGIFEQGRSEAEIASLFGRLFFAVNAFNLLMNLFLFNRLIAAIGVRNAALIQPVVYMLSFSFLFISDGFAAAVAGFFAFHGVMTSIEYNNQNLLFNALPERGKAEIRALVEGIIEPMAVALAGLFLVLFAQGISPDAVTATGLLLAVAVFGLALFLRAEYVVAMVSKLKNAWLSFSDDHAFPSGLSPDDEGVLAVAVHDAEPSRVLTAAELLWRTGRPDAALEAIAGLLDRADDDEAPDSTPAAAAMLLRDIARSREQRDKAARYLLPRLGVSGDRDAKPSVFRAELARWLEATGGAVSDRMPETQQLGEHVASLAVASMTGREEHLNAMMEVLDGDSVDAVTPLLEIAGSCEGQVRSRALEALERISDPDCIPPLLNLGDRFSPAERRQVEHVIGAIGLRSVPNLVALLAESECCHSGKSIAARALALLAFPQLESLAGRILDVEIARAYRHVFSQVASGSAGARGGSHGFLARLYRDLREESVDYILELLSLTGRMADHEMIAAALRSHNAKERANAVETIEQGCGRPVFRKLLPLIDRRPLRRMAANGRLHLRPVVLLESPGFLVESIRNGCEFESAAAFLCLWRGGQRELALSEITDRAARAGNWPPLLTEVVSSVLERDGTEGGDAFLNTIEKAELLAGSAFFSGLRLTELRHLASRASVSFYGAGAMVFAAGDPCDAVRVVLEGGVDCGARLLGSGALAGAECLSGAVRYHTDAVSRGARVLEIPGKAIWSASCVHPNIAVALLEHQLEDTRAA